MRLFLISAAIALGIAQGNAIETIRPDRGEPSALAVDSNGKILMLDSSEGVVRRVAREGQAESALAFGNAGPTLERLRQPTDVTISDAGDIVVADAGNYRITAYDARGSFKREIRFSDYPILQRVISAPGGAFRVLLWDGRSRRIIVNSYDGQWTLQASVGVDTSCPGRKADSSTAELAVDSDGNTWVVDRHGCADLYTLRKLSAAGAELGAWSRKAGQISIEAQRRHDFMALIVSTIFTSRDQIYVVLGAGGATTGGLDVDVWTKTGTFLRRSKLVGTVRPHVRVAVDGEKVLVADPTGTKAILALDLDSI